MVAQQMAFVGKRSFRTPFVLAVEHVAWPDVEFGPNLANLGLHRPTPSVLEQSPGQLRPTFAPDVFESGTDEVGTGIILPCVDQLGAASKHIRPMSGA